MQNLISQIRKYGTENKLVVDAATPRKGEYLYVFSYDSVYIVQVPTLRIMFRFNLPLYGKIDYKISDTSIEFFSMNFSFIYEERNKTLFSKHGDYGKYIGKGLISDMPNKEEPETKIALFIRENMLFDEDGMLYNEQPESFEQLLRLGMSFKPRKRIYCGDYGYELYYNKYKMAEIHKYNRNCLHGILRIAGLPIQFRQGHAIEMFVDEQNKQLLVTGYICQKFMCIYTLPDLKFVAALENVMSHNDKYVACLKYNELKVHYLSDPTKYRYFDVSLENAEPSFIHLFNDYVQCGYFYTKDERVYNIRGGFTRFITVEKIRECFCGQCFTTREGPRYILKNMNGCETKGDISGILSNILDISGMNIQETIYPFLLGGVERKGADTVSSIVGLQNNPLFDPNLMRVIFEFL